MKKPQLRSVPKGEPVMGPDIYARDRDKLEDRERWARVHIEADKRKPLFGPRWR